MLSNVGVNGHIFTSGVDVANTVANAAALRVPYMRGGITWSSFDPREGNTGASVHYSASAASTAASIIGLCNAAGISMVIPMSTGSGGGGFPVQATYSSCYSGSVGGYTLPVISGSVAPTIYANQIARASGASLVSVQQGAYLNSFTDSPTNYTAGSPPIYVSSSIGPSVSRGYDIVTLSGSIPATNYGKSGLSITLGSTYAGYANGLAWLASSVGGGLTGQTWEILNEYNINGTTDAQYAALLQAVYPVVKAADPTCTIMAGALTSFESSGTSGAVTSYNNIIAATSGSILWDAFSIHTYHNQASVNYIGYVPSLDTNLTHPWAAFKAAKATAGDTTPLWVTEMGWNTDSAWADGVTQQQQSDFDADWVSYLATHGAAGVLIYELYDSAGTGVQHDQFGLMSMPGFVPKIAYGTIQALLAPDDFVIPQVSVQVAFQNNPFDTSPTWTDITKYVTGLTTTMGRQHELQQVNPSTANITLSNQTGRFSPWNSGSPYYYSGTGLTPGHPVQIQATWGGTTYPIFYGYVKGWVPSYGLTKASMTLQCYDVLALLNLNTMDTGQYSVFPLANAAHYWPMTDTIGSHTASDVIGSKTATSTGGVTFGNAGPFLTNIDTCAELYGGGALSASVTMAASVLSYECWVNTGQPFFDLMSNGDGGGLISDIGTTGKVLWNIGGTSTTSTYAINDNTWHHVVGTLDGAYANLYIDGTLNIRSAVSASVNTAFVGFGVYVGSSPPTTQAQIAQAAIYTSALTPAQVASQYAIGTAGFVTQDTGSRIDAVLNLAGLPNAQNNVGTGNIVVAGSTSSLASTTVMSYINQVVNSERGLLFQDGSGVVQFYDRHYPYENATSVASQATFGYASNQLHYFSTGLVPGEDDLDLWNNINVSRSGGVVQNASDSGSQTAYGRRTLTGYTNLLFVNDTDSYDLASGLLYQYKNPAARLRAISMDSTISGGANLPQMLGLGLLDRVTVNWRPLDGSGVDFTQQSLIEQITHTVTPEVWTTTFALTPIGTESFATYGTSVYDTGIYGF